MSHLQVSIHPFSIWLLMTKCSEQDSDLIIDSLHYLVANGARADFARAKSHSVTQKQRLAVPY